jgi:tRNA A-37 threonylcarbamoyl transferase component Bud32
MTAALEWTAGGIRWQLREGALGGVFDPAGLFGPDGLRLDEWLATGRARVVKQTPERVVYRVTLPGLDFHLKHCLPRGPRDTMRSWVRPSKARLEYDRALALAERGVPTWTPLGLGESCAGPGPAASFLLTRTLPDVRPLDVCLEPFLRPPDPGPEEGHRALHQQALAVALGRFLARLHRAGVRHPDLHPGNLLLGPAGEEGPALYLIDLHAITLGEELDWPASRESLVMLNRWFALRSGRSDRLRCWHAYAEARSGSPAMPWSVEDETPTGEAHPPRVPPAWLGAPEGEPGWPATPVALSSQHSGGPPGEPSERIRALARELEERTWRSNRAFWLHHDARCLGGNRHFRKVHGPEVAGHAVTDLDEQALADLLADPDAPFSWPGVRLLKDSRSATVAEFDLPAPGGGMRRVIYKRFHLTRWSDPLVALVRPAPALRSYVMGHGMRVRCLPTPRPLGVWHRVCYGLPQEGYLLTDKVPQARHLRAYVDSLAGLPPRERLRALRPLIEQAARLVRVLHARGLTHRDLKAGNLLVSPQAWHVGPRGTEEGPPDGQDHLWFIDLVGMRKPRRVSPARRLQNVTRLHVSFHRHPLVTRTDKLRFLRIYLCWGLRGRAGWKKWWREIDRATQEKVARNLRNRRPLG